ncbi:MAG: 5-formyltetrahydrofolate cyclo-ligase, 5-formyltetrahydrofolate cyclo-ligase [Candidatus Peregrinibacteria bacterium GW2011_GWE2_39_6]|nr:MAG: 5-formyltetrahydrofolate cyclo-ligase, 5-formyltetrahydrofolate cyclo-ligase [Candidatus Peregrinibacteria bacterium GW2011_GWF2_39_17]KKR25826.1 MAG: 5-formyltetrahydrofolate cyclo-ligase, 5-formyltetrahydrofolate cyclo-ligase [Candidatus Peregrinibacteria bacterium GW2011_GWE2_39_6]HCW32269.1 5-formyltetrahydrofolate cyclo-ligase [Candidatus Peregrinibacteria bacterium]
MEKSQLRRLMQEKRRSLDYQKRCRNDQLIQQRLESLLIFKNAKTILFYVSNDEEVGTHELIKKYSSTKKIVVPVIDPASKYLGLFYLPSWDLLKPGRFGLLEVNQADRVTCNPLEIDLVIVPGVAFDQFGHRLGYGKGYYDRLLKKLSSFRVGLAYESQIILKIPYESHDELVNEIVTEQRILICNPAIVSSRRVLV